MNGKESTNYTKCDPPREADGVLFKKFPAFYGTESSLTIELQYEKI
jgi:hypothetical protein